MANNDDKQVLATLSVVFGAVSFIFCPLVFGLAGIVCGIIAACQDENKNRATVGIVLSCIGIPVGMFFGIWVASSL